ELERYLNAPTEDTIDIVGWWWAHRETYPCLHRMAIDYCSAPASTIDVERLFSTGRILLGHLRNRLSADSVRATLCLKSWWDEDMIDDNKLV
ncbi:HAT dimerization, partial [Exidia glandulosa HHB12029]